MRAGARPAGAPAQAGRGATAVLMRGLPALALVATLGACHDSAASTPFPSTAYEGRVEVVVSPPDARAYKQRGRATARFAPGGRSPTTLAVIGAISDPRGDAGLELQGAATAEGGWSGRMGRVRVDIDPQGRIRGGGIAPPQSFTIDGRVTAGTFDMTVSIELLEANAGGLPRGTTLDFTYALKQPGRARAATGDGTRGARGGRKGRLEDCKRIAYEVRPVPDPAGGTLVMRRVPVCKD